jgi:hypothetical protein
MILSVHKQPTLMSNPLNTVIIWQDVPSSACSEMRLRPRKRSVTIEWRSGHFSTHTVRRRDMLRLLNPQQSVGQWINRYVLG